MNGAHTITTDPLDLGELIAGAEPGTSPGVPIAAATTLGHMHLHVAQIESAGVFYADMLGFELMQRFGSSALLASIRP